MSRLYTARELAEIMQVHPQTIYRAAERGEIESYRIGRSVRFVNPTESEDKTNDKTTRANSQLHD